MGGHVRHLCILLIVGATIAPAQSQDFAKRERTVRTPPRATIERFDSVEHFQSTHQRAESNLASHARTEVTTGRTSGWATGWTTRWTTVPVATSGPLRLSALGAGKPGAPGLADISVARAADGSVAWVRGNLGTIGAASIGARKDQTVAAVASILDRHAALLGMRDPGRSLEVDRVTTDDLGFTHLRYRQHIGGIPVAGTDIMAHVDASGTVFAVNGNYEPDTRVGSSVSRLTGDDAIQATIQALTDDGRYTRLSEQTRQMLDLEDPVAELVYSARDFGLRLAYKVTLHANLVESWSYIIDADNGSVLDRIPMYCTLVHVPDGGSGVDAFEFSPPARAGSGTFTDAAAQDLNGVTQNLRVYQNDDGFFYSIWDLPNITGFALPQTPSIGGAITLTNNFSDFVRESSPTHVTSNNNAWADPASVSAHKNMEVAYRYFADVFGRKAINDQDQSMISVVHITDGGVGMDNAFWTGRIMGYGDGDQAFKPLAGGLDVAGHEMTHGVVEHTAGLIYQFQPGALNESMADVFGVMIDNDDFTLGEDIMLPGMGSALRDIENPSNPSVLAQQPSHMDQYAVLTIDQDNGGVHVNSGIPNRAAFLVIQALGREVAQQIYYRALSTYMTQNSQFGDARLALEQAATDLHGAGSTELAAVSSAFDSVGIVAATKGGGSSESNNTQPIDGAQFIAFSDAFDQVGILDPVAGTAQMLDGVYTNGVSQLSTPLGGAFIYFINDSGQLGQINTATGQYGVFDLFLFEAGDLWNVAVDPTDTYVMLASVYDEDPNLYISDGIDVGAIELKALTTQAGVFDESIVYPDVVSWSPAGENAFVAFDALRRFVAGADTLDFWSIYALDVATEQVFNLWPGQPEGYSIGNIAFANTDGDLMAVNIFDQTSGEIFLEVADFSVQGRDTSVEFAAYPDPLRPTFSPDDELLAFSSPSTSSIVVTDGVDSQAFTFTGAVFNPRWFAAASSTPVDDGGTLPDAVRLHAAYPNPFNPETTLRFELPSTGDVNLDVVDVTGRVLAVLQSGMMAAGEHTTRWNAEAVPSGMYFVRLRVDGRQHVRSLVLTK